ncbi:MAG: NADH-quinone oxidoreductase subunit E [Acidobacteria bacterium SCN 69-37]|nr:MAG: NADH-quinone oxidoreductase subunit E [Acidobacteria bacterium SCN 69-37]
MLSDAIKQEIESHIHEPEHRAAACTEALRIVQRERGWIDDESLAEVAEFLGMSPHELDGVATFFNLIHRRPVGRHVIRVCASVSCWVMGYEGLREKLLAHLGVEMGETTADGRFTVVPNQCLGCCDRAPALMIGRDLYRDVNPDALEAILEPYR